MSKYILVFFCLGLIFFEVPLYAKWDSKDAKRTFFYLEGGTYMNNIRERQGAAPGYDTKLSDWKGFARFHASMHIGRNWTFEPSLGTMIPARPGIDGNTKAFESQLGLQLGIPLLKFLRFRIGPGIEWVWMRSEGATVQMNNGTGTSSFFIPERNSHLFLFTMTSGLTIHLFSRFFLLADVYIPEVLSGSRRRFHGSMTLGVAL